MWGEIEPKIRKLTKLQKISQFTFAGLIYIIGSKKEIDCYLLPICKNCMINDLFILMTTILF